MLLKVVLTAVDRLSIDDGSVIDVLTMPDADADLFLWYHVHMCKDEDILEPS